MQTPPRQLGPAALWMTGSIIAFSLIAVAARQLAGRHDTFEIMTYRSAVGFVLVLITAALMRQTGAIRLDRPWRHVARNAVHFAGQNLWLHAIGLIPLAQVFALEFTSPVWVVLLAAVFLGERITGAKLLATAAGLVGIAIITRPGAVPISEGVLAAAGAALSFAITAILTKALTRGEAVVSILFWLTGLQFFMGLGAALLDGHVTLPDPTTLPWLGLIGLCGVIAHLSLTNALRLAPASFIVPVDFLRLPVIAVVGALAYGERLDPAVGIGGMVILAGLWINARAESRRKPADVAS